ncbi:kelch domain-containing protein 10 homolog [Scaptodrosophila lebanonensis]|uniref:Kelch domain-containing protein 10 homolog n=1 Tax=Drosophila lebanonensis TaxID=7225 RepID=A0A6J2UER8_DROLE|nr:kelch domain-containing protein 10 homolog [Scaptodrosophila lebanonensis]
MNILKPSKLKCILLPKLRHTWTLLVFVANLLQYIYRKVKNRQPQIQLQLNPNANQLEYLHNNNNNNNNIDIMEQMEMPEEEQHREPQADAADVAAVAVVQQRPEPMDASDMEENADADDEIDIDDDDDDDDDDEEESESEPEFEEIFSDDGEWTSSNDESEMATTTSNVGGPEPPKIKPIYCFQPLRLVKCQYKEKHCIGGFPLARSGHRIIASKTHLYSLGGYNPRSALTAARRGRCLLFQELWSYNFATSRWKLELNADNARNMPVELASNALAIHNNVLISHGGTGYPFGESCSNDCYVYRTGDNVSVDRLKVTGDLPMAQYGPGIVIHKHYLYTIGGTTGFDYSCDVYRLDLRTKIWENVYICRPEMREDPEGRYRHEVVYDGKHIFVLGGGTSHSVYDLQRIPAYNLDANCWDYFNTLPDPWFTSAGQSDKGYPKPRKCFSCVQHQLSNGDIEAFITGGLQGDFSTYFSDIWKLNLRTKQWSIIQTASLPRPLYFHSAAHSDNGCMYVFGGIEYNEKEMRRRNDLYKMWMTVPKLSEMCWDAITYYNDNLDMYNRQTLLKSGIPKSFTERLPPQGVTENKDNDKPCIVASFCTVPKRARPAALE